MMLCYRHFVLRMVAGKYSGDMSSLNPRDLNGRYKDALRKIIRLKLGRPLRVGDVFVLPGHWQLILPKIPTHIFIATFIH